MSSPTSSRGSTTAYCEASCSPGSPRIRNERASSSPNVRTASPWSSRPAARCAAIQRERTSLTMSSSPVMTLSFIEASRGAGLIQEKLPQRVSLRRANMSSQAAPYGPLAPASSSPPARLSHGSCLCQAAVWRAAPEYPTSITP